MDSTIIVNIYSADGLQTKEISKQSFILGRSSKVDVSLPFDGISRQHLQVSLEGDSIYIEDLNSSNGTFVNDDKIPAKKKIKYNQDNILRLGMAPEVITLERKSNLPKQKNATKKNGSSKSNNRDSSSKKNSEDVTRITFHNTTNSVDSVTMANANININDKILSKKQEFIDSVILKAQSDFKKIQEKENEELNNYKTTIENLIKQKEKHTIELLALENKIDSLNVQYKKEEILLKHEIEKVKLDKENIVFDYTNAKLELEDIVKTISAKQKMVSDIDSDISELSERTKELEAKMHKNEKTLHQTDKEIKEKKDYLKKIDIEVSEYANKKFKLDDEIISLEVACHDYHLKIETLKKMHDIESQEQISNLNLLRIEAENEYKNLIQKNQSLKQEEELIQLSINEKQKNTDELDAIILERKSSCKKIEIEQVEIKKQLESYVEEFKNSQKEIEKYSQEKKIFERQQHEQQNVLESLRKEIEISENEILNKKHQLEEATIDLKEVKNKIAEKTNELENGLYDLTTARQEIQVEIESLQTELVGLQATNDKFNELKKDVLNLETKRNALKMELESDQSLFNKKIQEADFYAKEVVQKANYEANEIIRKAGVAHLATKEEFLREAEETLRSAKLEKERVFAELKAEREKIFNDAIIEKEKILNEANIERSKLESEAQLYKDKIVGDAKIEHDKIIGDAKNEYLRLKKNQEHELGKIHIEAMGRIRDAEIKQEEEMVERRRFESETIARNLESLVGARLSKILISYKTANGNQEIDQFKHDIKKMIKSVFNKENLIGEDIVNTVMTYDPDVLKKKKEFWIRVAVGTGVPILLLMIHLIFPEIASSLKSGIVKVITPEESGKEVFLKKIEAEKANRPKFRPVQTAGYKDSYTDNVLYTQQFIAIMSNDEFQNKWVIDLNSYLVGTLDLEDSVIVKYISYENKLLKELISMVSSIIPENAEKMIEKMRTLESDYQQDIKSLFVNDEQYKKFKFFRKKYFDDYAVLHVK